MNLIASYRATRETRILLKSLNCFFSFACEEALKPTLLRREGSHEARSVQKHCSLGFVFDIKHDFPLHLSQYGRLSRHMC